MRAVLWVAGEQFARLCSPELLRLAQICSCFERRGSEISPCEPAVLRLQNCAAVVSNSWCVSPLPLPRYYFIIRSGISKQDTTTAQPEEYLSLFAMHTFAPPHRVRGRVSARFCSVRQLRSACSQAMLCRTSLTSRISKCNCNTLHSRLSNMTIASAVH